MAVPNENKIKKEQEKLERMWGVKTTVVHGDIRALGAVTPSWKRLSSRSQEHLRPEDCDARSSSDPGQDLPAPRPQVEPTCYASSIAAWTSTSEPPPGRVTPTETNKEAIFEEWHMYHRRVDGSQVDNGLDSYSLKSRSVGRSAKGELS